jgi:hypothetical protein
MDTARLEAEIASRNADQGVYMERAANSIVDNMQAMMPPPPQQMPQEQMPQQGQPPQMM